MSIVQQPFRKYVFDEDKDDSKGKVFTIRLNAEEIENLREAQNVLQQEKDSTALKQLAMVGLYVLHDRSMAYVLGVLNDNIRKNKRLGIEKVEVKP